MNMPGLAALALAAAITVTMTSCSSDDLVGVIVPTWSESDLALIPDTLNVETSRLVLDVFLNRDYEPPSPQDGRRMTANVTLRDVDERELALEINDPVLAVVSGSSMWTVELEESPFDSHFPYELDYQAGSGPKWGPQIHVDVVMGFRIGNGAPQRVIARHVLIRESS